MYCYRIFYFIGKKNFNLTWLCVFGCVVSIPFICAFVCVRPCERKRNREWLSMYISFSDTAFLLYTIEFHMLANISLWFFFRVRPCEWDRYRVRTRARERDMDWAWISYSDTAFLFYIIEFHLLANISLWFSFRVSRAISKFWKERNTHAYACTKVLYMNMYNIHIHI